MTPDEHAAEAERLAAAAWELFDTEVRENDHAVSERTVEEVQALATLAQAHATCRCARMRPPASRQAAPPLPRQTTPARTWKSLAEQRRSALTRRCNRVHQARVAGGDVH